MEPKKKEVIMLPATRKGSYVPSIFDDIFNNDIARDFFSNERATPAVNVSEDENKFNIEVAAPGLDKKDFKVNVENNVLTISSEKEDKKKMKAKTTCAKSSALHHLVAHSRFPTMWKTTRLKLPTKTVC
ncbi:MAG: Hsp20 family protein [Bacteroidales bacterium]|nr:Hsp20 family protein [Bacteroidales bacterium]